jgi:hypothetical protein
MICVSPLDLGMNGRGWVENLGVRTGHIAGRETHLYTVLGLLRFSRKD